jgi:RNA recognition motif-containing protein
LSYFCEEHNLFDLFKGFGVVTECRIKRNDRGGRTLMYGFVTMPSLTEAEHAAKSLNGRLFMGRNIR